MRKGNNIYRNLLLDSRYRKGIFNLAFIFWPIPPATIVRIVSEHHSRHKLTADHHVPHLHNPQNYLRSLQQTENFNESGERPISAFEMFISKTWL